MKCLGCGHDWFMEEKQILPLEEPAANFFRVQAVRERYVYKCASCGLTYPEKPKKRRKKT